MANAEVQVCDLLIDNAHVLTMDAARTVHENGAVAVTGNRIAAVGPAAEIGRSYRASRVIDAGGSLVHPGMIDLHYHATVHMVGKMIAEVALDADAGPWVAQQYTGLINALDDEAEHANALLCGLDMLKAGITAFMDPGTAFAPDAVAEAATALGMRASLGEPWLWDVRGVQLADIKGMEADFERCMEQLGGQLWRNRDEDGLVRGHVALYGMGAESVELALAAKAAAEEEGAVWTMHQSQSADDAEDDDRRFGRHPLVYLRDKGVLGPNGVFVHMNVLRDDEIVPVVESGLTVVWSPSNTWYYGTRTSHRSRMPELFAKGVNVGIGTDVSKASGFGDQLYTAYVLARDQGDYVSPEDLLQMVTANGARGLGMADRLGSLEPGKLADIVIRTDDLPEAWPRYNPVRQHLLLARSKSVDTVIVGGETVLRGGRLVRMDEAVVYAKAQAAAEAMRERAGL
ncbi:MAG: amidohydrolase family protein [Rhodospirillaceae bacterium]|jgi:5-methylthioadenosine/S-adenosylhomocysteine deaminase|nr:amidohydrolase family protein [Rhodospirillaceae bacterium]